MMLLRGIARSLLGPALMIAMAGNVMASVSSPTAPAPTKQAVTATMLGMPLQFEANQGQVGEPVKFLARGSGYALFLTPTESVMVLQQREAMPQSTDQTGHDPVAMAEPTPMKQAVVRMKLEGASAEPAIEGLQQLPGIVNYFIGNDPAKWRTKISTYAKVQYKEAYPGIDLAYYGNQGKLEYDFIVSPGADPNQIRLAFEGASDIKVADTGDLLLTTMLGDVRIQKPIVYQLEPNGHKTLVAGNYVIDSHINSSHVSRGSLSEVRIQLAAYDSSVPLIIDPVLVYSSYLGGGGIEEGHGIAVDALGQVHITGHTTTTTNFSTVNSFQSMLAGGYDGFVAKFNATGSALLYSTYIGGNSFDEGNGIALDSVGNAYVTGQTNSTNFPLTANPISTTAGGFVSKLNVTGGLVYSTYLPYAIGFGIGVDGLGQAVVTGSTQAPQFPTVNAFQPTLGGGQDMFVAKIDTAGSAFVYSTFLGGPNKEAGEAIAVDSAGFAYVTGSTFGGFPTLNPFQPNLRGGEDAFVAKFGPTGTLVYSTYLGSSGVDVGEGIAADASGQAYVTGSTSGANFPTTANAFQPVFGGSNDVFVTIFSADGQSLSYSTFLGGTGVDAGYSIAVDSTGQAVVTGQTFSLNFTVNEQCQPTPASGQGSQVFVAKLNVSNSGLVCAYLGGSDTDVGYGVAVDTLGKIHVTGYTNSVNFPAIGSFQGTHGGGTSDVFVAAFIEKPLAHAGSDQSVPEGTLVTLDGTASTGGSLSYIWTQVAGPPVALGSATTAHPTFAAPHVPAAGGTVTFELVVCEGTSSNCSDSDIVNVHITNINQAPVSQAGSDQTVQEGSAVILNGTASYDPDIEALTYTWLQVYGPPVTLANPLTATPSFVAPSVGAGGGRVDFELVVTDPYGLNHADYVSVFITNVNQAPVANAGPDQTRNENTLVPLDGSASHDPDLDFLSYSWIQTGGPTVALTGANTPSPTFTAPEVAAGGALLTFQLIVNDSHVSSAADTVQVAVVNVNDPPVCTLAQASPNLLWPPNHTMTQVSILGLTDPNNQTLTITYPTVTQDEPINGLGDGDTSPDAAVAGNSILLRAERSGTGNGRVYVVHFTATDTEGAHCNGTVRVSVPHSKKDPAIEGAQLYNSFAP